MEPGELEQGSSPEAEASGEGASATQALDATAAALAAQAGRSDPELAREAAAYFRKQTRLVDIQSEHLHEQRAVNLSLLKLRQFGERLKVGLQLVFAMVAAIIAIALIRMVWSAANDHALIVEAFSVPPDLAARGITGQVVAAQVLDRLGEINSQANSSRLPTSYAGNWGKEAKVEIPETGISVDELQRFFRDWLGHETHITGELLEDANGLAMTVRAGEEPGRTVTAESTELSVLVQKTAEAAFESTQPYRYTWYLNSNGRRAEGLEVARKLSVAGATARERAWAWTQICGQVAEDGDLQGSEQACEMAIAADPTLANIYINYSETLYLFGEDEAAFKNAAIGIERLESPAFDIDPGAALALQRINQAVNDDLLGDFQGAVQQYQAVQSGPRFENWPQMTRAALSYELARAHDVSGSIAAAGDHPLTDAEALQFLGPAGEEFVCGFERAVALEDWSAAIAVMRDSVAEAPRWPALTKIALPIFLQPRLAFALARGGQQAEAESIAAALPKTCYRCARTRGWVATTARDWARADREFAEAVRQGPSFPTAYADWGYSMLMRGDANAAIEKFRMANARGADFAEALEGWGEALAVKGDTSGALDKFAAAAQLAPRWGHLQLVWASVLQKSGRAVEAAAHIKQAAGMDLNPADRAVVPG